MNNYLIIHGTEFLIKPPDFRIPKKWRWELLRAGIYLGAPTLAHTVWRLFVG